MTNAAKRYVVGFSAAAVVAVFVNLLPYAWTQGAYQTDGVEVTGVPFTFRRFGGLAGVHEFDMTALIADIGLALIFALVVGHVWSSARP